MAYPDEKHLAHVQGDIVRGVKAETRLAILAEYSISDQLNARGAAKTTMQNAIRVLITAGATKQAAVLSAKTFAELDIVIPMKTDTIE